MFRIVFDPKVSRFVVQIMVWHLFWRDCHREIDGKDGPVTVRITFGTWKDAVKWVADVGLRDAYFERQSKIPALYPEAR